ncbi:MAG: biliverdin-producing heme oxygenase [Myxococcota bacterium]
MTPSLSNRLRTETGREHRLAEAARLTKAFFGGKLDLRAFMLGLSHFEPVYAALEDALDAAPDSSVLAPFRLPVVYRRNAILTDLQRFDHPGSGPDSPYAARIRRTAAESPARILGHFYVRYFADLSGVARSAPIAHRLLGVDSKAPLAFFTFPDIPDRKMFKNKLRALLDKLPRSHHDEIVDEARVSFSLHRDLVDELFDQLDVGEDPNAPTLSR